MTTLIAPRALPPGGAISGRAKPVPRWPLVAGAARSAFALCAGLALLGPAAAQSQVEQGRYLVRAGDCEYCHTADGGKPWAGGRAMPTGMGVIDTPNITPDKATGIGGWSSDDLYRALHSGHDDEGHALYPAFPYPWFTKVRRADVDAIKAYLDTLQPVNQPNHPLPWWLRFRPLLAGWNLLNFDKGEFRDDPQKSAQWNRGAYLVEGLGHCGDCHTPKRFFGGTIDSEHLSGGATEAGFGIGWFAPSLNGDSRSGLGQWSVHDIAAYLKTGVSRRTASAGPMSEVIRNSTSHLNDADLTAIALYLKDQPPRDDALALAPLGSDALQRGQALFIDQCAACHRDDGGGLAGVFPTLQGSSAVQARGPQTVLRIVLKGEQVLPAKGQRGHLAMPGFGWKLSDGEIADVVNYVRNAWGNRAPTVNADTVADMRSSMLKGSP